MPRPCLMASHRRLGRLSLVDNTDLGPSVDWPTSFDARLIVPKNGHFLFTINTTKDSKFKHLESRQKVKSRAQESSFEILKFPCPLFGELSADDISAKLKMSSEEIPKPTVFCVFFTNKSTF